MAERTYKIGEAAGLLKLKSYVLRFWETEFSQLSPMRTGKGQRLYTESDLELLKFIRHLLHERGLTIEGARKVLQSRGESSLSGLSSELLDEGYKDFGAEGIIPEEISADWLEEDGNESAEPPESASEFSALTRQAELAANHAVLRYALAELKEIGAMLRAGGKSL